jgi:hypothetical protein
MATEKDNMSDINSLGLIYNEFIPKSIRSVKNYAPP